eukprot:5807333-Pleurochrysis_carterae.AAC.4
MARGAALLTPHVSTGENHHCDPLRWRGGGVHCGMAESGRGREGMPSIRRRIRGEGSSRDERHAT